ncbi:superinfection immunity protein [Flavobacterium sp. WC2509]|uniref:superinfection immunity protein n=1 Tax=Flavobacterium sp. WC2509 TaxID=3461406 RepID=UPI004044A97A
MEQISITVIIIAVLIYFFPSVIAFSRSKSNTTAIVMLNLFLGWSFIGWIIALIWAVSKDRETQQIIVNNNSYSEYKTVTPTFTQPIRENIQNNNDGMQKILSNQVIKSIEQNPKSHQEKIENLQKLKELLDDGILTQQEFDQQKKQILG